MVKNDYRYALLLIHRDGTILGRVPVVEVDWEPPAQWFLLRAARQGRLSLNGRRPVITAEPVWHEVLGEPYIGGVCLGFSGDGDKICFNADLPTSYFNALAQQASTYYVNKGDLHTGERFSYFVQAYYQDPQRQEKKAAHIFLEPVNPRLDLHEAPLADFIRRSAPSDEVDGEDLPVFIPQEVLHETVELAQQAGAQETGGVLIGYLRRDSQESEIFLELTAQIPARHVRSETTRLTFTPDTWSAAQDIIKLRANNEIMLGWWHSHSFYKEICKDCEKRRQGSCTADASFMSQEDCRLHRTCFPCAYSVALVVADSPCSGLSCRLFGWRYGLISPRGFHVLTDADSKPAKSTKTRPNKLESKSHV